VLVQPVHITAKPEDISKYAIVCGDPARVEQVAALLKEPRVVNTNRGFIGYTGYYEGLPITVIAHGVGSPSMAIVAEELRMLGSECIVRLGTTGAMRADLDIGDIVIPSGAAYGLGGSAVGMYVQNGCMCAVPDPYLLLALISAAGGSGARFVVGPVFTSDAFYAEDPGFVKRWSARGIVSVEMECAALFTLGLIRGFRAGAVLFVSNNLLSERAKEIPTADKLKPYAERAARVVLKALVELSKRP